MRRIFLNTEVMTFGKCQALLWEHPMTCGAVPGAQFQLPPSGMLVPPFHAIFTSSLGKASFQALPTQIIQSKQSSYHLMHGCNNALHTYGIILITSRNKHHPSQVNWDEEKVSMFSEPGFTSSVWFHGSLDILTPPFLQFHRKFQPPLEQGVSKTRIWVWKGWNARTGHCL